MIASTTDRSIVQPPQDAQGRSFRKLRVSLTDACNYACTYCVPAGMRRAPKGGLDAGQLLRCVALLQRVTPLESLRITGGEPLIAPQLEGFLEGVARLRIPDVSLTTNGQLLARRLDQLRAAGIARLNVSLDSLVESSFRDITRGGDLAVVLAGIEAARQAGMQIKLNMVPVRGANDDQVVPLLQYALAHGFEVRYIELMRMGHLRADPEFDRKLVPMSEILARIATEFSFREQDVPAGSTARRWAIPGQGRFGVIPNVSAPFCGDCDRLRLTAQGRLYGCLSSARSHDMSALLDQPDGQAMTKLEQLLGSALEDKQPVRFEGMIASMRALGG